MTTEATPDQQREVLEALALRIETEWLSVDVEREEIHGDHALRRQIATAIRILCAAIESIER